MITEQAKSAVARVEVYSGKRRVSRGTGFLVAEGLLLTALHVVGDRKASPTTWWGDHIELDFRSGGCCKDNVTPWQYDPADDWCLLSCTSPPGISPIPLTEANDADKMCLMWGFPDLNAEDGKTFPGEILDRASTYERHGPVYEIDSRAAQGAPVEGLSGSPCLVDGMAVGVMRAALEESGRVIAGALYACPVSRVVSTCKNLEPPLCLRVRRTSGAPFQVPPLREWFVERPEAAQLETSVLNRSRVARGLPVTCVWGMRGEGKATLINWVARGQAIRSAFEDRVLWVRLGRTSDRDGNSKRSDLIPKLNGWIEELSRESHLQSASIEAASMQLRTLLADKACLLVVVDAWEAADVEPFLVGGPHCHLVMTTHRRDVGEALGAEVFDLPPMTLPQCLDLLSAYFRRPISDADRVVVSSLAEAVGRHPLALEQVGAARARGKTWEELARAIEDEVENLRALKSASARRGQQEPLEASLNVSLEGLRDYKNGEDLLRAFAWLGVLHQDAKITAKLAATLWKLNEDQAQDFLELLWNDALLQTGRPVTFGSESCPSYMVHGLFHDKARSLLTESAQKGGLGLSVTGANELFLERQLARATESGSWFEIPDDGYIHEHLCWHLVRAGRDEQLHELLSSETPEGRNAWFEVRDRLGQSPGYFNDLNLGWMQTPQPVDARISVERQLRYALSFASVNSLANTIPGNWIARLVNEGLWGIKQGLFYAYKIRDHYERAVALAQLWPRLAPGDRERAIMEALGAACLGCRDGELVPVLLSLVPAFTSDHWRELLATLVESKPPMRQALVPLVPHVPDALLDHALEASRSLISSNSRPEALSALRPRLSTEQRAAAIDSTLREAHDEPTSEITRSHLIWDSIMSLQALEAPIPEDLFRQFLHDCNLFEQDFIRAAELLPVNVVKHSRMMIRRLFSVLVSSRPSEDLLRNAFEALWCLDWYSIEPVLEVLAPHLPEALLRTALAKVVGRGDYYSRLEGLRALAPYLSDTLWHEALEWVSKLPDEELRAIALDAVGSAIAGSSVTEAVRIARSIEKDPTQRARALAAIAKRVDAPLAAVLREEAMTASRADAIFAFAPDIPDELVDEALVALRGAGDEKLRLDKFSKLLPRLPAQSIATALDTFWTLSESDRVSVLAELALRLGEALLSQTVSRIRECVKESRARCDHFLALVPALDDSILIRVLDEILLAKGGGGALLAPDPDAVIRAVLEKISSSSSVVKEHFAPYLRDTVIRKDDDIRRELIREHFENWRKLAFGLHSDLDALGTLVEGTSSGLLRDLLPSLRKVDDADARTKALTAWASHATEPELREMLTTALSIWQAPYFNVKEYIEGLSGLAPHLPASLLEDAVAGARLINRDNIRARWKALVGLSLYFPAPERCALLREVLDDADKRDDISREEAILLVTPHLDDTLVEHVLSLAHKIDVNPDAADFVIRGRLESKARVLAEIAQHLPEPKRLVLLQEAVDNVKQIRWEAHRRKVWGDLAPLLPESILRSIPELAEWKIKVEPPPTTFERTALAGKVLDDAVSVARTALLSHCQPDARIVDPYLPAEVMVALARSLSDSEWQKVLVATERRASFLAEKLSQKLSDDELDEYLFEERLLARFLADLAPVMPAKICPEAIEIARKLRSPLHRAEALCHIAQNAGEEEKVEAFYAALEGLAQGTEGCDIRPYAPLMRDLSSTGRWKIWMKALSVLAARTRTAFLEQLPALLPTTAPVPEVDAAHAATRAVLDVGRWWP